MGRGSVFDLLGDYKRAFDDYRMIRKFEEYRITGDLGISEVLEKMGRYKQALKYVYEAYNLCSDRIKKIEILNQMIFLLMRLGDLKGGENAILLIQKLLKKLKSEKEILYLIMARAFYNSAIFWYQLGSYDKALQFSKNCVRFADLINDKRRKALSYNLMGILFKKKFQFLNAIRCYKKSLNLFSEIGDTAQIAGVYNNLGSIVDDPEEALEYYHQALEIFKSIGYKMGIVESIHNIANSYLEIGLCKRALKEYKKSYLISKKMSYPFGEAMNLAGIGKSYIYIGNYDRALLYLSRSLRLSKEINDCVGVLENRYLIAKNKIEKCEPDAYQWIKEAKKLAIELSDYSFLIEILFDEFKYLKHRKDQKRILKLKSLINKLRKRNLKIRQKIFLEILGAEIVLYNEGKMGKSVIERLKSLWNKTKDSELIFEIGKALVNVYIKHNPEKAQLIYSMIYKSLIKTEMDVFKAEISFLEAKLNYYCNKSYKTQLNKALILARKLKNKRLHSEINLWLKK